MTSPQIRWAFSICWILVSIVTFFALEASSARSWLYLAIVAVVPPAVVFGLWREDNSQTVGDVMRGTGNRS